MGNSFTWNNSNNGSWSDPVNWADTTGSQAGFPGIADDAAIDLSVTVDAAATSQGSSAASLEIGAFGVSLAGIFTVEGTLTVNGSLALDGAMTSLQSQYLNMPDPSHSGGASLMVSDGAKLVTLYGANVADTETTASGSVSITSGGSWLVGNELDVGGPSGSFGGVSVDGAGSKLTVAGNMQLNYGFNQGLSVTNDGLVTTEGSALIGYASRASVSGSGSTWTVGNVLYAETGLTLSSGGTIAAATFYIDNEAGEDSVISVDGAGTKLTASTLLFSDGGSPGGTSRLEVSNGAIVDIANSATLDPGASIYVPLTNGGEVNIGDPANPLPDMINIAAGGKLVHVSTLPGPPFDGDVIAGIVDDGTVESASGLLTLSGPVTGSGGLQVDGGGTVEAGSGVANTVSVIFGAGGGRLLIDDPADFAASINNFGGGDAIAFAPGTVQTARIVGNSLHVVLTGGGAVDYALTGDFANATAGTDGDGNFVLSVACFAAGTGILTTVGEVAIEHLEIGGLVITVSGDRRPIRWIGRRHVDCNRHPDPRRVWPVRVRAGAFGPKIPRRDVFLSPDHSVYVDGVLIPVKYLINDASVAQVEVSIVEYFHVELDQHSVLFASGLAAESLMNGGDSSIFDNGDRYAPVHPGSSSLAWEAFGCAPLVVTGSKLDTVRRRLQSRLGHKRSPHRAMRAA